MTELQYLILARYYKDSPFSPAEFLPAFKESLEFRNHDQSEMYHSISTLAGLKYIEQVGVDAGEHTKAQITLQGKKVYEFEKNLRDISVERERRQDEKAIYDLKNATRIFKTYWWTFRFSVVALLISLALLIMKIFGK